MFSYPDSDYIFSHFLGKYLVYIFFLLICGNYPLTSKRRRFRNILYIDSLSVLRPQMATKKAINLMKVIRVIKGLATIPETYHAHI